MIPEVVPACKHQEGFAKSEGDEAESCILCGEIKPDEPAQREANTRGAAGP